MIGAGDLRQLVVFQRKVKTPDGLGSNTVVWTDAFQAWAAFRPVSAKEIIQAEASAMVVTHQVRIRYRKGVMSGMRMAYNGKYYNIISIMDVKTAHRWLDILAREAT